MTREAGNLTEAADKDRSEGITERTIEIRIKHQRNGSRIAFYRVAGSLSSFWHSMPVRQAEKALREGRVSIGLTTNAPAVAALGGAA